jgi:Kef-type K+ transport system membrane component KefB
MAHLFVLLVLLALQGVLLHGFPDAFASQEIQLTVNFGFLLLAAYLFGEWAARIRLPKLSGYLLAGILLGPDVLGTFSRESVASLRFIDELALTYIALTAGLELRVQDLRKDWKLLLGLSLAVPLIVFPLIFLFLYWSGEGFGLFSGISSLQKGILAALAASLAIARSPSSTVAIIKECRARGRFSETVLGVTVVTDILVIVCFSFFLALSGVQGRQEISSSMLWISIPLEIFLSFFAGLLLAGCMSIYTHYVKADRIFFFLCVGFLVTRLSDATSYSLENYTGMALHLEPLLISMSAGFCLQNVFPGGAFYEETIERSYLPIFVIFFALAGTALDLGAFFQMWPCAMLFAVIRFSGIWFACTGTLAILREPVSRGALYGMSFITQAGVSIGLAGLFLRRFPQEADVFYTLLLAVILMNQMLGPVAFKVALEKSGEARTGKAS